MRAGGGQTFYAKGRALSERAGRFTMPALALRVALLLIPLLIAGSHLAVGAGEVPSAPSGPKAVSIAIVERAQVARQNEYVSFGVPIPKQWDVKRAGQLRLLDRGGKPIPADIAVLARWGGPPHDSGSPAKWVLVGSLQTVPAGGCTVVILDASGPGPQSPRRIAVSSPARGRIAVDTGAAVFQLRGGQEFNLIDQVTIAGKPLLEACGSREAIQYLPAGPLSLVEGGKIELKPRKVQAVWERNGDLCKILKVTGSIFDATSRPLLDFTARLHFVAGRSDVRLDFTVENNHPIIAGEDGQPTNAHRCGAVNSVYIGSLGLRFRLADGNQRLRAFTEGGASVDSPPGRLRLYQDSSGTQHWNVYVGQVGWDDQKQSAHPRLQSYCSKPGFEISASGAATKSGRQAAGWLAVRRGDQGPSLVVAVRDFWQNFPKAIDASPDGTVTVDLFPNGGQFRHNLRVGEQKTHSVLLDFTSASADSSTAAGRATAFNRPLVGLPPSEWCVRTGALGEVPPVDRARWPLYERYVRTAFEPNPDFDTARDDPNYGNRTLRDVIEHYNFYGWQDYGDVPLDFEAFGPNQAGQFNLKYWYTYGMLLQFCRSSDPEWLDLALPAASHLADIDILHIPDAGPQHWAHGAYFGHSEHDEPGNVNPNRNANSPSVDLFFGVPDLLLAYCLTGDGRYREAALEGPESMIRMMEFSELAHPVFQRERANMIFGFLEAYRATGENRWLEAMRKVVAATTDLSNKPWVTDPSAYGKSHPGEFISMFSFSQVVWALGKYLDFCGEYGLTDDLHAAEAIRAYADFLLKFARREYAPGRATTLNAFYPDGSEADTYLEINNWALLMADVLAYAAKYSGEKRFIEAAAPFYATGTIDPVWQDDPPVYLASKDLVNSLNWGLVYMNQSLEQRPEKARPAAPAATPSNR